MTAVISAFAFQPLTPAQAAALWNQSAHAASTRTAQAAPKAGNDPTYQPPPKHGTSYVAPTPTPKPGSSKNSSGAEKLNLRTRNSRTFSSGGRQLTTLVYSDSVNYRDASGTWQAIDDSLVKTGLAHYAYQNMANRYTIYLPADIGSAPIRVVLGSSWLTFSLQGAKGAGSMSGSAATYREALPGVTVVVDAQADALEESLVLQGPASQSQFTYQLLMSPGLKLNPAGNGFSIVDASGRTIFGVTAPAMYDSAKNGGARSSAVSLTATKDSKGTTATLKADPAWLDNSARKWPVTVDPTFIVGDVQDCYINGGSPTTSFCGGTALNAGYDGTNASRALLQFNLSAIPTTDGVVSAKLLLYLGSASTSTPTSLSVYQLTRAWTTGATWNTYDGTTSWTTPGGDFSGTAAATTNGIAATGIWYSWSPTALVQGWVNGTIANDGLIVKEPTENVSNVLSFNSATAANPPYLQVVHQQGGSTPGSYSTTVQGDSPAAYWRMDETSGSTMVDAQSADSGTYQGGFTLAQTSLIQPASGSSVSFNGSTGYATAATLTALQGDNTRSVELWFQTTNNGGEPLFDSGNFGGANYTMFNLQLTGPNTVANNPPPPNTPGLYLLTWGEDVYIPGLYLADGKRHQVVVELSGNNLWIYVDNTTPAGFMYVGGWNTRYPVAQPFNLPNTPNTTGNPILIGNTRFNAGGATNFFQGQFDEVAIYSTALSATQVQNHWQAGNGLPWAPTNVTATPGQNQVALSWTAPTFNGSGINGYVVTPQVGGNLRTPITFNSSATSETISNLSGGTSYAFTVNAFNSLGLGVPSSPSSAVAPTGPAVPLYEDTVLADSPVGFWPLGETSFNVATDLTQTYNGQDFGSYSQGDAGPVISVPSKAINLSGTNAYVRLDHTTLLEPAAVTVEAWLKPSSVPANDTVIIISPQSGNSEWSTNGYDLVLDGGNGKVTFNAGGAATTLAALPIGVWSYVVGTSDGTAARIYVNGKQQSVGSAATTNYGGTPTFDALITRFGYPGDIADVAIYGSALTASQIAVHYAAAGYAPGPVSNLVATASTNSASLTWTAPSYVGTSPITSYTVTPVVDGKSSTPITVNGQATGANVANLVGTGTYTFQVAANNSSGLGVALASGTATIGAPSSGPGTFDTSLLLKGGPGNGQAFSHYGFVSGNNVPALATWTIEERVWGIGTLATTGSHMALGALSGSTSNPTDQSPVAGLNFNIGGSPLQTYFVWPGGSCTIPSGSDGIGFAFNSSITTPAHVALTYDGTTVRGFIDGTLISGCSVATGAAALSAGPFGFMDNAGLAQGNFDEIRVSNTARWVANFTPPSQQYAPPYDSNTMLLWHFNDYSISQVLSTHILSNEGDGVSFARGVIPSTYRDTSASANHANTIWASGASSVTGNDDWRRAYSLGPAVTADELVGSGSLWLCVCAGYSGAPVNHATGELWHTFTDFNIPGRVALDFTRTYSTSRASSLGPTGFGWTDRYWEYLTFDGAGNATVHEGNGSAVVFTFTSPSTYTAPPSEHATLVKNGDSTFTLTDTAKNQTIFNPQSGTTSSLQKIVDRHGGVAYTLTMAYNPDGTLASVTDPASRRLNFSYQTIGSAKLIQTISDTASPARTVSFQYGTNSSDPPTYQSLTQVTDVAGGHANFTYNSSHYLLTMTDPSGGVTTNTYDSFNRIATQRDALMRPAATYTYTNGITTVTDPKGNITQEEYLNGILMTRTKAPSSTQQAIFGFTYDPNALATTGVIGPNGQTSTSTRDSNANVLTTTDSEGRIASSTFNSFNEPLTRLDPSQITTTFTYNSTGDTATMSRPLVGTGQIATTTYTYGDSTHPGDVTKITDADGNATTYTYDTAGDQTSMTDPLGNKTTYVYDTIGRMTSMVTPKGNVRNGHPTQFTWSYTYDAFGNRLTVTDPLSHTTTYHFDPNQNLDKVTDADGNVTTNVYDLDNELTQVKRADSPQTTLITDYNADATIADQKDGKGNAIMTYAYDSRGRVTTVVDALGNTTTYAYDGASNVATIQDPGGNCAATPAVGCTTYVYDSANQPVGILFSDGTTPNVSMTYDLLGQRIGMTDGTGTSSWARDSLERLVNYTNGSGVQVQWAYNLRNLPTTITYPGSLNVIRAYDAAGRWISVQDWNLHTTTFGYDVNSNLTTETYPTGNGIVATNTYDNADRLTAISDKKGNTTIFAATYTLDGASLQTSDTSASSGQSNYKYTPLHQLCYAGSSTTNACSTPPSGSQPFAYDAADNLTQIGTTQQVFNNADELCWTASTTGTCSSPPSGATTYQYDNKGNRTAVTPNPGQAVTMTFDQANRLTKYVAASTESYGYNGDGLRMCKVSGSFSNPCSQPGAAQFVWDISAPLPLLLKDGGTSYVYGPGDGPVEQVTGTSTVYFHHDQLGSTRAVTNSSGTVQATYTFQPFGQLASSTNPGNITNPIRFAGQYLDTESGSYYLRARYYDPNSGQFISRDPLVGTTRSAYGYAGNSPANAVDPSGAIGFGLCGNFNFMAAVLNGGFTGCLVETQSNGMGETGGLLVGYVGGGAGADFGGAVSVQVSNADHLENLANWFGYFQVSGSYGAGASITVFFSLPWASRFTYGGEVGPQFGAGLDIGGGISFTVARKFGGWQATTIQSTLNAAVSDPVQKLTVVRRILDQRGITGAPRPGPC